MIDDSPDSHADFRIGGRRILFKERENVAGAVLELFFSMVPRLIIRCAQMLNQNRNGYRRIRIIGSSDSDGYEKKHDQDLSGLLIHETSSIRTIKINAAMGQSFCVTIL